MKLNKKWLLIGGALAVAWFILSDQRPSGYNTRYPNGDPQPKGYNGVGGPGPGMPGYG